MSLKSSVVGVLSTLVSLPFRAPEQLKYYLRRVVYQGMARGQFGTLDPSIQFDGPVYVRGTGRVSMGLNTRIGPHVEFVTEHEGTIRLGKEVRINRGTTLSSYTRLTIGDYSMVGEFVSIRDANHSIRKGEYIKFQGHDTRPITIGTDVWIGRGACVLPGVTIGDGSIIGANSVVTRDIPPFSIAVGTPARVVKARE